MLKRLADGEDPLAVSIRKWEDVIENLKHGDEEEEDGTDNCALCETYKKDYCSDMCPVKTKTGKNVCDGTPYEDWSRASSTEKLLEIAKKEVAFLKSLQNKNW